MHSQIFRQLPYSHYLVHMIFPWINDPGSILWLPLKSHSSHADKHGNQAGEPQNPQRFWASEQRLSISGKFTNGRTATTKRVNRNGCSILCALLNSAS